MAHQLNKTQFDVLYTLSTRNQPTTQRQLQTLTGHSLGKINTAVRDLENLGYLSQKTITELGRTALEPYAVENAIILAAGLSSRFAPISYERPKGTLRVRGEILIERQIEQLHAAGITDITVVVGYRKEHFFYLIEKYGVSIVVNEEYATRNNNGSLWRVKEKLGNTYVCSSDNYFTENPFESHVYHAYYSATYVAGPTNEWCLTTGPGGRIIGCTIGGSDAWTMLGHVYFDREFSTTFTALLERVYHLPQTAPKLWEYLFIENIRDFDMVIRKYRAGVINEFDSVDELREFDPYFMANVDSEVFNHITAALSCDVTEIRDFYPLKQGLTNLSCHFSVNNNEYVYRHPGIGTEALIDREAEEQSLLLARSLGLDTTLVATDPAAGWKISKFVANNRNLDITNDDELDRAMQMMRRLHESGTKLERRFDFVAEGLRFEQLLSNRSPINVPGYRELREKIVALKNYVDQDQFPLVPSHNDFHPLNFLIGEDSSMNLIDWEYAGMSDVAADFGTMVVSSIGMTTEIAEKALRFYLQREATTQERYHYWAYVVFAGWCWYVWALLKEAEGDDAGEWLLTYYKHATHGVDELLAHYKQRYTSTD